MAGPTTTNFGWQLPDPTGDNDYPGDMATLGDAIDATLHTFPLSLSGLFSARPAAGTPGRIYRTTDSSGSWVGYVFQDTGLAWITLFPQPVDRTYNVSGLLAVPSGASNFLPPFDVSVPGGVTIKFVGIRAYVRSGSITADIKRNGSTVTGLAAVTINVTKTVTSCTPVTVADGDSFAPVIDSIASGTPDGLTLDFLFQRTG